MLFVVVAVLVVLSSIYDIYLQLNNKGTMIILLQLSLRLQFSLFAEAAHPILKAFSLVTNGQKLLQVSKAQQQIHCFNGLKVISLFWVIVGHRYSVTQAKGIINYDDTYSVSVYIILSFTRLIYKSF